MKRPDYSKRYKELLAELLVDVRNPSEQLVAELDAVWDALTPQERVEVCSWITQEQTNA